jgi:hypothetical protein
LQGITEAKLKAAQIKSINKKIFALLDQFLCFFVGLPIVKIAKKSVLGFGHGRKSYRIA